MKNSEVLFSADSSSSDETGEEKEAPSNQTPPTTKLSSSPAATSYSILHTESSVTQVSVVGEGGGGGGYDAGDEKSRVSANTALTSEGHRSPSLLLSEPSFSRSDPSSPVQREPLTHLHASLSVSQDKSPTSSNTGTGRGIDSGRRRSAKHSPKQPSLSLIQTKPDFPSYRWQNGSKDEGDHSTEPHSPYLDYYSTSIFENHNHHFNGFHTSHSPTLDSPDQHSLASSLFPDKRRYELWRGNNTFFLGGRLMTGSHPYQLLLSLSLIFFTSTSFILLIVPFYEDRYWYDVFMAGTFFVYCFLMNTSFTEPGIYPKRHLNPNNPMDIFQTKYYHIIKPKYCLTCAIIHSNRSKHCKYCNNCVEVFDHHCPWTGNCIGLRNYSSFFGFISCLFLTLSYMLLLLLPILIFLCLKVIQDPWSFTSSMHLLLVSAFIMWVAVIYIFIGALLFLHIYLCFTHQTTNEYFRQRRLKQRQALGLPIHQDQSPSSSLSPLPQESERESGCFEVFIHNCGSLVYSIFLVTPLIFQKFSLNLQSTVTNNTHPSSAIAGRGYKDSPSVNDGHHNTQQSKPNSRFYKSQNLDEDSAVEEKIDSGGPANWQGFAHFCLPCGEYKNYQIIGKFSHSPDLKEKVPLHTRLLPFWQFETFEDDEQQEILLEILYNQLQHELFHSSDI